MSFSANRVAYSGIPTVVSHSPIEVGWDISTRPCVPGRHFSKTVNDGLLTSVAVQAHSMGLPMSQLGHFRLSQPVLPAG
jgi:hypothetical protein